MIGVSDPHRPGATEAHRHEGGSHRRGTVAGGLSRRRVLGLEADTATQVKEETWLTSDRCWAAWTSDAWEFMVTHKTERLIRSDGFRRLHRRIVKTLEEVGDTGTLSGDALREVLGPE
jgi:hypothetical protein